MLLVLRNFNFIAHKIHNCKKRNIAPTLAVRNSVRVHVDSEHHTYIEVAQ